MADINCYSDYMNLILRELTGRTDHMEDWYKSALHLSLLKPSPESINRLMKCRLFSWIRFMQIFTVFFMQCHETRSLETNRKRARERLQERLDFHYHGDQSYLAVKKREGSEQRKEKKRRSNLRLDKKRAFKEREGLDWRNTIMSIMNRTLRDWQSYWKTISTV